MGLFTPKYPKSETPGATGTPAKRESRAARKDREFLEFHEKRIADGFKRLHRESKERTAAFWDDYERRNGPDSGVRT